MTAKEFPLLDEPLTPEQWALYLDNQGLKGLCYGKLLRRTVWLEPPAREALWDCLDNRLIRAAQSYRPEYGVKFSTFAVTCMERTGWQDFAKWCKRNSHRLSLDYEVENRETGGFDVLAGLIDDGAALETEQRLDYEERVAWLRRLIGEKAADLLIRRHVHEASMKQLAAEEGVSKESIRIRLNDALGRLQRLAVAV